MKIEKTPPPVEMVDIERQAVAHDIKFQRFFVEGGRTVEFFDGFCAAVAIYQGRLKEVFSNGFAVE